MRSSYPIGRMVVGLLCGSMLLAACETSPTQFDNEPQTTETPLRKITLTNLSQHASAQGVLAPIEPPTDTFTITLADGEGTYTKTNDVSVIKVKVSIDSLADMEAAANEPWFRYTDYALGNLEMQMEITPAQDEGGIHLEQNRCVTDNSILRVYKRKHYPQPPQTFIYPIDATIENLVERKNDKGETVFEGDIHIYTFSWPQDPFNDDVFIYDLRGTIHIE